MTAKVGHPVQIYVLLLKHPFSFNEVQYSKGQTKRVRV